MNYEVIQPSAFLSKFVRFFWVLEHDGVNNSPYVYRSMADGCVELLFHYKGNFEELTDGKKLSQYKSILHGQSQKFRRFETTENFGIFGAYLYPFAVPYLFSVPSVHLTNEMPD